MAILRGRQVQPGVRPGRKTVWGVVSVTQSRTTAMRHAATARSRGTEAKVIKSSDGWYTVKTKHKVGR